MAKAKKLPSGKWRCLVYDGKDQFGKRQYKSFTAETKKEAEYMAMSYFLNTREKKDNELTLGYAIEKYIEDRQGTLSPSTVETYRKYQRVYFKDIQNYKIKDIDLSVIQAEVGKLAMQTSERSGKPLTLKTIKARTSFFLSVLEYFDVHINSKKIKYPQKQKNEYATPTPENIANIIKAVKETQIEIPVLLAVWLSLRMSEVLGLEWKHINKDSITICQALVYAQGSLYLKSTKTMESTRVLPMPKYIYEILQKEPHKSKFVVNLSANAIRKQFSRLLEKNDIPHCRFHDLRHANASIMMMLGVPDKYAMQRGGWTTGDVYKNIYVQTFEEEEKKIAGKIDKYFDNLIN